MKIKYDRIWKSGDLKVAQKIYSHYGNGEFTKWVVEEYGMSDTTARRYIKAYEFLIQYGKGNNGTLGSELEIQNLGVYKLSSLSKLTLDQQKQVIENAPLNEIIISYITINTQNIQKSINNSICHY